MSNFITYGGNILTNSNVTRAGIAYNKPNLSGRKTSFEDYDDGWHLSAGTYDYIPPTNPINYAQLDNSNTGDTFTNLLFDNAFGNKDRFTNLTGGTDFSDEYIIDHLTGLGWNRIGVGAGNWTHALTASTASSDNGFSDWRIPSARELTSISNLDYSQSLNYSPFSRGINVWASTTRQSNTTQAHILQANGGVLTVAAKTTTSNYGLTVRNHYPSNLVPAQEGIQYRRPYLTSQTQSWHNGDDGWHLANGTYDYVPPANPTHTATLDTTDGTPYSTLVENNAFGNKLRITDITGGTAFSDGYVIDHLTGLGYYNVALSADTWENHLDEITGSTQNGYTDWRMPNANEYRTLQNFQGSNTQIFTITGIDNNRLQSSTTRKAADTTMFYWFYTTGYLASRGKVGPDTTMMVRNHYN